MVEALPQPGQELAQLTEVGVVPVGGDLGEQVPPGVADLVEQGATGLGQHELTAATVVGTPLAREVPGVDLLVDEPAGRRGIDQQAVGDVADARRLAAGAFDRTQDPYRAQLDLRAELGEESGSVTGTAHETLDVEQGVVQVGKGAGVIA